MSQYSDPASKGYVVNPGRTAMDYAQAVQFVFQNPNWMLNLLFPALCYVPFACLGGLVPFVGPVLQQLGLALSVGYGWEGSASLLATNGTRYADFDFNRLGVYFSRAMGWLVFAVIVAGLSMTIQLGLLGPGMGRNGGAGDAQVIALLVSSGVLSLVAIVLGFFMQPMMFRAGLTGRINDAFDFGWGWGFFQTMWVEMLIAALFMILVSIIATLAGFLLLCVGVFLAMPFIYLVRGHLDYQLYELYLSRGGIPVMGVAPSGLAGYTPDPSNPYAAPAGGGYTPSPMQSPPPGSGSPPPSWPPPPPQKPNG